MPANYYESETFCKLSLMEETFSGLTLVDCTFTDCTFEHCLLTRCTLTECRFINCRISEITSEYSQVKFLSLDNCSLTSVNWGLLLPSGGFGDPLEKLGGCRLKYNFFTGMDLRSFLFAGSSFSGCMFSECNLTEGNFQGCELIETEFFRCNLSGADFRQAQGYKVDVPSCVMKDARFSLPEASNLLYSLGIQLE